MDNTASGPGALFPEISPKAARQINAAAQTVKLARGDVLYSEGSDGDSFYLLERGKIKLGRQYEDGRQTLIALIGPGELLGELSIFNPEPRNSTATAITPSVLYQVSREAALEWIGENPPVVQPLMAAMAKKLRRTDEALSDLVFVDVPGRLAKTLLDFAARFGVHEDGKIIVRHDLTQSELAQLIGASRETVNKTLAEFDSRGWTRHRAGLVVIREPERLGQRGH